MSLLTLIDHYNNKVDGTITSVNQVETVDTGTDQTFTLIATSIVLAIYTTTNNWDSTQTYMGRYSSLIVDDNWVSQGVDSPFDDNYPCRTYALWCGELAAGEHTIKGSIFHGWNDATVCATSRQLTILIFSGTEFNAIIADTTDASANSTDLIDDPNASIVITPSADCYALVLYHASNYHAHSESYEGKTCAIKIGSTDYNRVGKAPCQEGMQDSVLSHKVIALTGSTEYTIKGRFSVANGSDTVYIDERSLIVLLLSKDAILDFDSNSTQISTTSNTLVDDPDISITRNAPTAGVLFAIASAYKLAGTTSSIFAETYAINVDSTDVLAIKSSPSESSAANSAVTMTIAEIVAGSHTIKGRFSNNREEYSAKFDNREMTCLWFLEAVDSNIKAVNGVTRANIKSVNGVSLANIKSINGVA